MSSINTISSESRLIGRPDCPALVHVRTDENSADDEGRAPRFGRTLIFTCTNKAAYDFALLRQFSTIKSPEEH